GRLKQLADSRILDLGNLEIDGRTSNRARGCRIEAVDEGSRHSASDRLRSSCSKALAMRVISAGRAPVSFAVSRQVAVTTATSLMMPRAAARPRPKYSEAASRRSIEQVP